MDKVRRLKGVTTDLLNDKAKARIVGRDLDEQTGWGSSGNDHNGAHHDDDVSDASFSDLFYGGGGRDQTSEGNNIALDSESDHVISTRDSCAEELEVVRAIVTDRTDQFREALASCVLHAVEARSTVKTESWIARREVAAFLRDSGYNAGVCKTRWERSGGITAGNHEFIDVVATAAAAERYFVDLDFAADFEIGRPTSGYQMMLSSLPEIFVGTGEDLRKIFKAVSAAAKISLASRGLHRPPWRTYGFIQNKWFGAYRRTTSVSVSLPVYPKSTFAAVKCRFVGFDVAVFDRRFLISATGSLS